MDRKLYITGLILSLIVCFTITLFSFNLDWLRVVAIILSAASYSWFTIVLFDTYEYRPLVKPRQTFYTIDDSSDFPPADWTPSEATKKLLVSEMGLDPDLHMGGEQERLSGEAWLLEQEKKLI